MKQLNKLLEKEYEITVNYVDNYEIFWRKL